MVNKSEINLHMITLLILLSEEIFAVCIFNIPSTLILRNHSFRKCRKK